jgi:hypothetical protein
VAVPRLYVEIFSRLKASKSHACQVFFHTFRGTEEAEDWKDFAGTVEKRSKRKSKSQPRGNREAKEIVAVDTSVTTFYI